MVKFKRKRTSIISFHLN